MRQRSTSAALYQVDLIAALFAGFIVIWLATSSDAELQDDEQQPTYLTIEFQRRPTMQHVVDLSAVHAGCAPAVLVYKFAEVIEGAIPCEVRNHKTRALQATMLEDLKGALQNEINSASSSAAITVNNNNIAISESITIDSKAIQLEDAIKPVGTFLIPSVSWCLVPTPSEKSIADEIIAKKQWYTEVAMYLIPNPEALLRGTDIRLQRSALNYGSIALKSMIINPPGITSHRIGYGLEYPFPPSCDTKIDQDFIRICILSDDAVSCSSSLLNPNDTLSFLVAERP